MTTTNALDQFMPRDLDAERALLGSVLQQASAYDECATLLPDGAAEFSDERNRALWEVIGELVAEQKDLDGLLLKERLERRAAWEKIGKFDGIGALIMAVPSHLRARQYAEQVHRAHLDRRLLMIASQTLDGIRAREGTVHERIDAALSELTALTECRVTGEPVPIVEVIAEIWDDYQHGTTRGVPTGLWKLDELLGSGAQPGEVLVIGARTSVGKTALLLTIAESMARDGRNVLVFSVEMSRKQLAQRVACARAGVSYWLFQRRRLNDADLHRFEREMQAISAWAFLIDDTSRIKVSELRARARLSNRRRRLDCVLVDYVQIVAADRPRRDRYDLEIGDVMGGLKALAKELSVPVIAAAQISRKSVDRAADPMPRLSDLRDSGSIEQDADSVLLLHRPNGSDGLPGDVIEAHLAKQRNGPTEKFRLGMERGTMRINNATQDAAPAVEPEPAIDPGLW